MSNKSPLTILVVDRQLKADERVVKDIFSKYGEKYGLIIFPPKQDAVTCIIQVVFCHHRLIDDLRWIFRGVYIDEEEDIFYDFDLHEIEEDTFYDMLSQTFEVETFKLTDIEKCA